MPDTAPYLPHFGQLRGRAAVSGVGVALACLLTLWGAPIVPTRAGSTTSRWNALTGRIASRSQEEDAEARMREAVRVIRVAKARASATPTSEAGADPSGLIGAELTPLVTTLGSLDAKRTAAKPMWASVLARELAAHGIARGDVVAASFSGSFPGLNLALMAATRAIGAETIAVSSVTASTWGANEPGFTWPEMEVLVVQAGILPRASIAIAAGGDGDVARDLEPDGRAAARSIRDRCARALNVPALVPRDARDAIAKRMALYRRAANGRRIALYVNVGGAGASLGSSDTILRLRSGFLPPLPFDRSEDRGVMARFAEQGVPILTLLNIRDLALRWGIPLG